MRRTHDIYRLNFFLLLPIVTAALLLVVSDSYAQQAMDSETRDTLTKQLEALEKEAAALDKNVATLQGETKSLKNEISIFDKQIKQREIEIKRLGLVILQTQADITRKTKTIKVLEGDILTSRNELAAAVRQLDSKSQNNLLELFLQNDRLSSFFNELNNLESIQKKIQTSLASLRINKEALEKEKTELEDYREEQEQVKSIQEIDRRALQQKRTERDNLLKITQGKESLYQDLLKKKKTDIAAIRNQLYYLQKTGITAEEALAAAKGAAGRTNIRAAFLLGLLEVETGRQFENGQISVGSNLGTGNWKRDMYDCYVNLGRTATAEKQKAAFFKIAASIGEDPDKLPVSRKPNYGCGGAMGPAQFIATTWLLFADRAASLLGKSFVSPWNVDDAFTAAGIFLGDSGATSKTKSGEIAAARTYISGNPNCPSGVSARYACISYANRVYSLSLDIERAI